MGYDIATDPVDNCLILVKDPNAIQRTWQESDDEGFNYEELDRQFEGVTLQNEPEQLSQPVETETPIPTVQKKVLLVDMSVGKLDPKTVRLNYLYRGLNGKILGKKKRLLVGTNTTGEAIRVDTSDLINPQFRKHKFGRKEKESAAKLVASLENKPSKNAFEKYAYLNVVLQPEASDHEKKVIDDMDNTPVAKVMTYSENLKGFLRETASWKKLKKKKKKVERESENGEALVFEKTWYYGDYFKSNTDLHHYPTQKEEVSSIIQRILTLKHEAEPRTDTGLHSPRKTSPGNRTFMKKNRRAFGRPLNFTTYDSEGKGSQTTLRRENDEVISHGETSRELSREVSLAKTDRLPVLQTPNRAQGKIQGARTSRNRATTSRMTADSAIKNSMDASGVVLIDQRKSRIDDTSPRDTSPATKLVQKRPQRFKSAGHNNKMRRNINSLNPYKVAWVFT